MDKIFVSILHFIFPLFPDNGFQELGFSSLMHLDLIVCKGQPDRSAELHTAAIGIPQRASPEYAMGIAMRL